MKTIPLFSFLTLSSLLAVAQKDTVSIELSTFTKKLGLSEALYVAVFIKSNIPEQIKIDDSRDWINCFNSIGVKLIWENLQDNCYQEVDRSDCHPLSEDQLKQSIKSKSLEGYGQYSYIIEVIRVVHVEETGLKRTIKDFNSYRFKLELPFQLGNKWYNAASKNWVYYAYPR